MGKRVLPLGISVRPGEDLKLYEVLPQVLQAVDSPRYYPSNVKFLLEKVNETSKRRTGSAVVVYLQLTTKSRGDKFSRDACDDIASTLGAITYDNAACKFILEVSVSAVADIIIERFDMSDLVVVRPLPPKTSYLWSRRWQKGKEYMAEDTRLNIAHRQVETGTQDC